MKTEHISENENRANQGGGAALPREKWTMRHEMEAHQASQELLRVEAEVRTLARELGAKPAAVQELVERARVTFRPIGSRVRPLESDGRTELRSGDGAGLMSVAEWVGCQARALPDLFERAPRADGYVEPVLPMRNPFLRKNWNLTEQMRLRQRDPQRAARLKVEAWRAEG